MINVVFLVCYIFVARVFNVKLLQCVPAMVNSHVGHEIEKEKYIKRHKELLFGL